MKHSKRRKKPLSPLFWVVFIVALLIAAAVFVLNGEREGLTVKAERVYPSEGSCAAAMGNLRDCLLSPVSGCKLERRAVQRACRVAFDEEEADSFTGSEGQQLDLPPFDESDDTGYSMQLGRPETGFFNEGAAGKEMPACWVLKTNCHYVEPPCYPRCLRPRERVCDTTFECSKNSPRRVPPRAL